MKTQIMVYLNLLIFLIFLGAPPVAHPGEIPGPQPSILNATGIIVAKEKGGVTLMGGEYFKVPFGLKIVSSDEKPLPFRMLPVPCKAEIQYVSKKKERARVAVKITIKEVLEGAKYGWHRAVPE